MEDDAIRRVDFERLFEHLTRLAMVAVGAHVGHDFTQSVVGVGDVGLVRQERDELVVGLDRFVGHEITVGFKNGFPAHR